MMGLILLPFKIAWWFVKLPFKILGFLLGGFFSDLKSMSFQVGDTRIGGRR